MDPQSSTSGQKYCLSPVKKRRRVLSDTEKTFVHNVYKFVHAQESKDLTPFESPKVDECATKTAQILGVGKTSVYKVIKEGKEKNTLKSPIIPGLELSFRDKLDDFTFSAIQQKVPHSIFDNEAPAVVMAVKKSRFKSKQRTQETFTQVSKLKAKNQMLEEKVKTLTKQLQFLKELLLAHASNSQIPKFDGIDLNKLLEDIPDTKDKKTK